MNPTRGLIVIIFAVLVPPPALASLDGIWWNPNIPGEGWNCSSQADTMFCLQYGYEGSNLQPSYRSIIATLTHTILSNGDLRITALGDVFRTESFTNTVRTGAFQGIYEAGVFRTNAAGQEQTLIPFDFAYGGPLEAVQGFFLTSTVPIAGLGLSQLHLTGTVIQQTSNGIRYKEVFSSDTGGLTDPDTLFEFPAAIALYRGTFPFPAEVDVFIWPTTPFAQGVLLGVEASKAQYGFSCRIVFATGQCLSFGNDITFMSLANSEGETRALASYFGFQSVEPRPSGGISGNVEIGVPNMLELIRQRIAARTVESID